MQIVIGDKNEFGKVLHEMRCGYYDYDIPKGEVKINRETSECIMLQCGHGFAVLLKGMPDEFKQLGDTFKDSHSLINWREVGEMVTFAPCIPAR